LVGGDGERFEAFKVIFMGNGIKEERIIPILLTENQSMDYDRLKEYLQNNAVSAALEGMYWISLPEDVIAKAQQGHEKCGPFVFAVELGRDSVTFELLVRSSANLHCSCTSYATAKQRQFVLDFFDAMVLESHLKA